MISRREFFGIAGVAGMLAASGLVMAGCSESRGAQAASSSASSSSASSSSSSSSASSSSSSASSSSASASSSSAAAEAASAPGNAIVVYFSHTGENYSVGYIDEGNTAIVADMVAAKVGAQTFEIVPSSAYPEGYDACCDVALEEKNAGVRPAYSGDTDLSSYDTVYLGYPIWWGDLPMCVYTFIEAHDWSGKEVHPFCTHAGSGLAGTVASLQSACAGATVAEGLAIEGATAQNSRSEAQAAVDAWIS